MVSTNSTFAGKVRNLFSHWTASTPNAINEIQRMAILIAQTFPKKYYSLCFINRVFTQKIHKLTTVIMVSELRQHRKLKKYDLHFS